MSKGLKIYACSGLGVGTTQREFGYWRDNTRTVTNTRAVNNLLAEINAISATLQYGEDLTKQELLHMLNLIDMYVVCLQAARDYANNELSRFGNIIAKYVEDGAFVYPSTDDTERDNHLDTLYMEIETAFQNGNNYTIKSAFTEWFSENVVDQNYQGFTPAEQQKAETILKTLSNGSVSGTDSDASELLFNCGGYYLYLFMDEDKAKKLPYVIYKKWKKEKEVYNYVHHEYDKLMSKDAVDKIIYTGICKQYNHTPDYVISQLTQGKGVGDFGLIEAIAALITAIVAALSLLCQFIVAIVQAKYAEPASPSSGTPEDTDWGESEIKDKNLKKTIKFGIIGLAAIWLLSKIKK